MTELNIITDDPFNILSSTKRVLENSHFVKINDAGLAKAAEKIDRAPYQGVDSIADNFSVIGNYRDDVQMTFMENALNFCFWSERGKEKWHVSWDNEEVDGWYALKACFKRALANNIPILNAKYLSSVKAKDIANFFEGSGGTKIPLLAKRLDIVREIGRVLSKRYDGHFLNLIEETGHDAVKVVKSITDSFPSFRDVSKLDGNNIYFLKRAQITAFDLNHLRKNNPRAYTIKNIDKLTVFAEYKLPQILRTFGAIEYTPGLAAKTDNYILIPPESREEIEIRAATVWCVELIRQRLKKYNAGEIDNALWIMGQNLPKETKPYHRTYTIYY